MTCLSHVYANCREDKREFIKASRFLSMIVCECFDIFFSENINDGYLSYTSTCIILNRRITLTIILCIAGFCWFSAYSLRNCVD